jgi:hypothetical protein
MSRYFEDVAIDPLALLLPSRIYVIIAEKEHPHEPVRVALEQAMKTLNAEEKAAVIKRARLLGGYAKLAEEAALTTA